VDLTGLYFHIPWCRQVCHYCDFAKTANHDENRRRDFLDHLVAHTRVWLDWYGRQGLPAFSSVFFGGGTPSIYGPEYQSLFAVMRPFLTSDAEVTLEANPDDITPDRLSTWQQVGVNRLSIGVQTFEAAGLTRMHRVHSGEEALAAIAAARQVFSRVNIDLIYGWDGQTEADWQRDLQTAIRAGVPHLSLYNLTYEPRTVIGRRAARGRIIPADEERLEGFYSTARSLLGAAGFDHEEVSNWSRPGHSCRHNWLYWSGGLYLGIGPGAHGYLPAADGIGVRYAYPRNERQFAAPLDEGGRAGLPLGGLEVEEDRTMDSWIVEMVGASLRTVRGVDLHGIAKNSGRSFTPGAVLTEGLIHGQVRLSSDKRFLTADPGEWFREQYWALAVIDSF
jgi:oxygen-independent coproporphyrinogen-3 oxidase